MLLDGRDLRTLSLPWYRCALAHVQIQQHTPKHAWLGLTAIVRLCESARPAHAPGRALGW